MHPDAFGILRWEAETWPFFLECERRVVRPVTMAARLAPYARYYSPRWPIDDHGVRPAGHGRVRRRSGRRGLSSGGPPGDGEGRGFGTPSCLRQGDGAKVGDAGTGVAQGWGVVVQPCTHYGLGAFHMATAVVGASASTVEFDFGGQRVDTGTPF